MSCPTHVLGGSGDYGPDAPFGGGEVPWPSVVSFLAHVSLLGSCVLPGSLETPESLQCTCRQFRPGRLWLFSPPSQGPLQRGVSPPLGCVLTRPPVPRPLRRKPKWSRSPTLGHRSLAAHGLPGVGESRVDPGRDPDPLRCWWTTVPPRLPVVECVREGFVKESL